MAQLRTQIAAPADQPFLHANSGVTLPVTLGGLPRLRIEELAAPQLDVMTNFESADGAEAITVYLYHTTAGSVPVWFDRATWAIEARPLYGTLTRRDIAPAFVPHGQPNASAMMAVYAASGDFRATGVALIPLGDWLVKLRQSSKSMDAAALEASLRAAVAAIGWPTTIPRAPDASPVPACANALAFKGRAKPVRQNKDAAFASAVLGGFIGMVPSSGAPDRKPQSWCRDSAAVPMGALYRAGGATDSYLIALSDAGRGVWVQKDLSGLIDPKAKPAWSVSLVLPGSTAAFAPVDRLPAPADALAIARTSPIAESATWGTSRTVTLARPAK